jgi:DNA-binding winged helix-turn-helix (wHTH) protein/tetratricopeptide (TPR) repeat protein
LRSLTRYRFGVFEFDTETPELRKSGRLVRLRPQGHKLLKLLISRPREVIGREEIARFLWDAGVFVDFEQGVNHTIKQLRSALGDDAESPRYVETLPRRGYRFIAPVEALAAPSEAPVRAGLPAEDLANRTAGIPEGRLEPDLDAATSLSQSAPLRLIGRIERHRTAIAVVTCAVLSIVLVRWWVMSRPPAASSTIASVAVLPFNTAPPAKSPPATRNPEAYDAYLRGLWHFKGRPSARPIVSTRGTAWRSAVVEFERAVALDPEFALARAALASAYTQLFFYDSTDRGFDEKAFLEIHRALATDPNLPEAYLARAQLTWTARNRFPHEAAIRDLHRALALNANVAEAYLELEKVYYHIGLTDEVIAAGQQVQRLDPSRALSSNRTFRALIDAGRLEEVRGEVERNGNLGPYARGDALLASGRLQDAQQFLSRSKATLPGDTEYDIGALALLGVVYARLQQAKEAERVLAVVIPAAENPTALSHIHHAQLHIGAIFGLLGRKADAVRWLTKAADEGYPSFPRFSTDPSLAPLKGYPAYEALLVRLRNNHDRWQKSLALALLQPASK